MMRKLAILLVAVIALLITTDTQPLPCGSDYECEVTLMR